MNNQLSPEAVACNEYEKLLKECQDAFELLDARRKQVRQASLTGVEVGRELLRLQAAYAKAYSALLKHAKHFERCQSGSPFGRRGSSRHQELCPGKQVRA